MLYLESFTLPSAGTEEAFLSGSIKTKRTVYSSCYPFGVFSMREMPNPLIFEPVTIFYGGNGSGKSTILNLIAQKLGLKRDAPYNRSDFFEDYLSYCSYELAFAGGKRVPAASRIITSDDVFDYLLNIRSVNQGVDLKREALFDEYAQAKYSRFQLRSMADYERLKTSVEAKSRTQSRFVNDRLMKNIPEKSNGESALMYFTQNIDENALYLLDEPENSLSARLQFELMKYVQDAARFFNCQFIFSTHSPFLLSLRGAAVYDLDSSPVRRRRWTELENVRLYRNFFMEHESEFE